MRSLFAKSIITVFVVFSLGTSLAWASTSSRPGMFLYPLKMTTQKVAQVLKNIPAVEIHLTAATPPPVATVDHPADDPTPEPTSTTTATTTSTATATRVPTPVKAADKITPTATATAVSTIAPPPQTLGVESSAVSDGQSSQRNSESSHDNSSKSNKPSDDSGKSDSEGHSSKDSSGEDD